MSRLLRHALTLLLLTLNIANVWGQSEPKFATARESEAYRTSQLFKIDYKKENHERYKGKIIKLDKMTYKFDTVTLQVFDTPHEFLAVFDNGLLSTSNSGFSISHIEELTDLNPSSTVKRFKYQLHIKGIANPTVVFFELTNENVTAKTKTKKFIEGSTMTFYKWGWPMI
jgi:hypothetical protein